MSDMYILEGKRAVPFKNTKEWGKMFEMGRHVADETIDGVRISTVFLGIDHSFGDGKPQLFETMIFGGIHNDYQKRCETWEEAEEQHKKAVDLVKETNRNDY